MDIDYSRIIGKGIKGELYATNKKNIVVKIINKLKYNKKEYTYSKKAGELRIGPKIYKKYETNKKILIYMERIDTVLTEWITKTHSKKTYKETYTKLVNLVNKLHNNNIIHGDIHMGNIGKIKNRWVLIDYGWAHKKKESKFLGRDIKAFFYKPLYSNKGYADYFKKILVPYSKLNFLLKLHHLFIFNRYK